MTVEDPSEEPRRPWPFGMVQTVVLVVVVALIAGVIGWQIGDRDGTESFNDADAGFLADMTAHHNGALSLAFEYLKHEHDPSFANIAREIVTTQAAEMAVMNLLVADAGNPAIATDDVAMEWLGDPMDPSEMPGMATEADYDELRAARGLTADDVFTRLMVRHHAAGAAMARSALAEGENPRVRRLARTIVSAQQAEIDLINRRRSQLGLPPVDTSDVTAEHEAHH